MPAPWRNAYPELQSIFFAETNLFELVENMALEFMERKDYFGLTALDITEFVAAIVENPF